MSKEVKFKRKNGKEVKFVPKSPERNTNNVMPAAPKKQKTSEPRNNFEEIKNALPKTLSEDMKNNVVKMLKPKSARKLKF